MDRTVKAHTTGSFPVRKCPCIGYHSSGHTLDESLVSMEQVLVYICIARGRIKGLHGGGTGTIGAHAWGAMERHVLFTFYLDGRMVNAVFLTNNRLTGC